MKKTIFKFPIKVGLNEIQMPVGAQILTAQMQRGAMYIWCIVDESEMRREARAINVFGTGHPLPEKADVSNWISTIQGAHYVWHLFEF